MLGLVQHAYAEQVAAPVEAWALVPQGLDLQDAAAIPLVGLTGVQLIEEAVTPASGQTVLVTGAVGGVGRAAVYAARLRGARVLAGVRTRQRSEALSLEAAGVVAIDDPNELASLPMLDAIADTVGGETIARLLAKVKPAGVIGSVVGEPAGAKERGLTVRSTRAHPDSRRLQELAEAVARGDLRIPVSHRFQLARAAEAHKLAERGGVAKVLLLP